MGREDGGSQLEIEVKRSTRFLIMTTEGVIHR